MATERTLMSPLTLSRQRHRMLIDTLGTSTPPLGRSRHFTVYTLDGGRAENDPEDVLVVHDFTPEQINNNVAAYVADELLPLLARVCPPSAFPPSGYAYSENETFERYVGAIVRSMDSNERRAWHRFYDNTLAALRTPASATPANGSSDFIATFRSIYGRVAELVSDVSAGSILDVATCFGFLPLFLAGGGKRDGRPARRIVGCDLNSALVALADDYRRQRLVPGVSFVNADILGRQTAGALDPDGNGFGVVTAIHLLEHLTPDETLQAMETLWGLTAGRLILAVPFEAVPDPRFGHRQVFDRETLLALLPEGYGSHRYFEHHGGWLVIDRTRQPNCNNQREDVA